MLNVIRTDSGYIVLNTLAMVRCLLHEMVIINLQTYLLEKTLKSIFGLSPCGEYKLIFGQFQP